jgi:hypothetical protein
VWVTDGTAAGTQMLGDLYPGSNGSPQLLGLIGTDLIFAESTSLTNWQIFRSDGTSAGTRPITNFPASSYSAVIESFITPNGKIYMQLQTAGVSTSDLWVSDGNGGNVTQIMGGTTLPFHLQANSFRQFGNDVLLNVNTEEHGSELGLIDPTTDALSYIETARAIVDTHSFGHLVFTHLDETRRTSMDDFYDIRNGLASGNTISKRAGRWSRHGLAGLEG